MSVRLDHTIVPATDRTAAATFLAGILGLEVGAETGPFLPVTLADGVTLDFMRQDGFPPGHYAFAMSDAEFDAAYARVRASGVAFYADPMNTRPGDVYRDGGVRGLYFRDPSGHNMEILTAGQRATAPGPGA